jgi:phosphohistidine phosphatase SixA
MMRAALLAAALLTVSASATASPVVDCQLAALYLTRHAEKAAGSTDPDVPLSDAGKLTAEALTAWFAGRELDAIYTTHLRRTQQTAAPLAAARDLDIRVLPASDSARLVARLKSAHCGERVLVVGHSNTVPEIAAAFGAEAFEIGESEFGWIYSKTLADPAWKRERFAPATP